ncbi:hypothetical protein PENTCL1PPCAC_28618, partial [Pristionchus entomophagus]
ADEEFAAIRSIAYTNVVKGMLLYCDAVHKNGESYSDSTSERFESFLSNLQVETCSLDQISCDTYKALMALWQDAAIQRIHEKKIVSFPTEYFMSSLDRIFSDDFVPTMQDIIHAQGLMTGVMEVQFKMKNVDWRIFEVRIQRSQIKKWIYSFDVVEAVTYVVDLTDFDQKNPDDSAKRLIRRAHHAEICGEE